jgi:hypothetical protein
MDCLDCLEPSDAGEEMGGKVRCCISPGLRERPGGAAGGENARDMGKDVRSMVTEIASRSRQNRWMGSNGSSKSPDWGGMDAVKTENTVTETSEEMQAKQQGKYGSIAHQCTH